MQKHPSEHQILVFFKGLVRKNINIKAKQGGAANIKLVSSSCHRLPHGHENWLSINASNPNNKRLNGKVVKTAVVSR